MTPALNAFVKVGDYLVTFTLSDGILSQTASMTISVTNSAPYF
jgi:hypothetical protein